jgi:hypothetical protein
VSRAVAVYPGSRFAFDGEVVEVTGFEGTRVTLRDGRDRWRTLGLAGFLARAAPLEAPQGRAVSNWRRQPVCDGGDDRADHRVGGQVVTGCG